MSRIPPQSSPQPIDVDALCDAVRAAYPHGPDAVVAIVRAAFTALSDRITALEADVAQLHRRLGADSTNSSKPPSTDISRARRHIESLRVRSGMRPGGQPGHEGSGLAWHTVPDAIVDHVPLMCAECGCPLPEVPSGAHISNARTLDRAQVYDLPPVVLTVTEHRRMAVTCERCGLESAAQFPHDIVSGVQYGSEVKSLAVALHGYHLLPYGRTAEFLDAVLGDGPSTGSVVRWVREAAVKLEGTSEATARSITAQHAAHADETSLHVNGKRYWLHVASTGTHTHYHVHEKRGFIGIDAGGVWGKFRGVMVHDGWWPYGRYREARHQLCLAHLRREALGLFTFTKDLGHPERWLTDIEKLLGRLHRLVGRAAVAGRPALARRTIAKLSTQYDAITRRARRRHPYPKQGRDNVRAGRPNRGAVAAFADRLIKYREDVLRCARDARIPADNNQAERDIRMAKLADKISGGFRTMDGARQFCTIRSALSTARKQGRTAIAVLRDAFSTSISIPSLIGQLQQAAAPAC